MSTNKSCTNCPGATDHDTAHCPMMKAEGAQGPWKVSWDYSGLHVQVFADIEPHRPALTVDLNGAGSKEAYAHELAAMLNRAALAQPSPAPEHPLLSCLRENGEAIADAAIERQRASVAPELERPEVVAWTVCAGSKRTFDFKQDAVAAVDHWHTAFPNGNVELTELMTVAQHDRIVGALRADREVWAERWIKAVSYGARVEEQRDAAQAGQVPDALRSLLVRAQGQIEHLAECTENLGEDLDDDDVSEDVAEAREVAEEIGAYLAAAPAQGGE